MQKCSSSLDAEWIPLYVIMYVVNQGYVDEPVASES